MVGSVAAPPCLVAPLLAVSFWTAVEAWEPSCACTLQPPLLSSPGMPGRLPPLAPPFARCAAAPGLLVLGIPRAPRHMCTSRAMGMPCAQPLFSSPRAAVSACGVPSVHQMPVSLHIAACCCPCMWRFLGMPGAQPSSSFSPATVPACGVPRVRQVPGHCPRPAGAALLRRGGSARHAVPAVVAPGARPAVAGVGGPRAARVGSRG